MNIKYILTIALFGFYASSTVMAQGRITINQSTSVNDPQLDPNGSETSNPCGKDYKDVLYFYIHVYEKMNLSNLGLDLKNINNGISSTSIEYIQPPGLSTISKKTKSIGPGRKLEKGTYLMSVFLDEEVERSQILDRDGIFEIDVNVRYRIGGVAYEDDFSMTYKEKMRDSGTISVNAEPNTFDTFGSYFVVSVMPQQNQTLIEFDVAEDSSIINIRAVNIMSPGQSMPIITNQTFKKGEHRLIIDNDDLPFGVSQILLQKNERIYSKNTIRL